MLDETDLAHFPEDKYHPHYTSKDKDHHERLTANSATCSNPFRLVGYRYSPAQEVYLSDFWRRWKLGEFDRKPGEARKFESYLCVYRNGRTEPMEEPCRLEN